MAGRTAERSKSSAAGFGAAGLRIDLRLLRSGLDVIDQALVQLLLQLGRLVRLRIEAQGARPLEARFLMPPDLPVGVAQVIVEHRIGRRQRDRALELLDRFGIAAERE